MAARQSPVSVDGVGDVRVEDVLSSSRVRLRVMPGGVCTAGVVRQAAHPGTRSWRDTVGRGRPGRSAEMARSTMVSPAPTSSRSPSGAPGSRGGDQAVERSSGRPAPSRCRAAGGQHAARARSTGRRRAGRRSGDRDGRCRALTRPAARAGRRRGTRRRSAAGRRGSRRYTWRGTSPVAGPGPWWVRPSGRSAPGRAGRRSCRWRAREQVAVLGRGVRRSAAGRGGRVDEGDSVAGGQAGRPGGTRSARRQHLPRPPPRAVAFSTRITIPLKSSDYVD